jgi:signal transduction histidine kinase
VLGLLFTQGDYHISLAVMMIAVFASVVQFGLNLHRAYRKELVLDAKNRQLIASLTQHQLQLEAANQARLQFFASASHDLRQPMHALGLFAEGLRDFVIGQQGQNIYQRMQTSIAAMEGLIDQLLSVANMDAGAVVPKPVRLSLQAMFDSLQSSHEALARAKGLELHFMRTKAVIDSDPILIARLLGNLVTNAIAIRNAGVSWSAAAAAVRTGVSTCSTPAAASTRHISSASSRNSCSLITPAATAARDWVLAWRSPSASPVCWAAK